jgi:Lrp/AsnC family transcriptional regulator, leucine-responsive regulatory protein
LSNAPYRIGGESYFAVLSAENDRRVRMYDLDKLDLAILGQLEKDGRMQFTELAKLLGKPTSTVRDRVRKLEQSGVIRGYSADIDLGKLGYPIRAVVQTTRDQSLPIESFLNEVAQIPEIERVQLLTGDVDELITVNVRDVDHLREFLYSDIVQLPGISRTNSTIVLMEVRYRVIEKVAKIAHSEG